MIDYKQDKAKVDLTLVHLDMAPTLEACAALLQDSLKRRGYPRNGYKDLLGSEDRLMAACYRHMAAMANDRLAPDTDSGMPHLVHAITNLMMLHEYLLKHPEPTQEAPKGAQDSYSDIEWKVLKALDDHANSGWAASIEVEIPGGTLCVGENRAHGCTSWRVSHKPSGKYKDYCPDRPLPARKAAVLSFLREVLDK